MFCVVDNWVNKTVFSVSSTIGTYFVVYEVYLRKQNLKLH
jgi:hypothetical protein